MNRQCDRVLRWALFNKYDGRAQARNTALSLAESLQILDDVHAQLCAVNDNKNVNVIEKFESVINNDFDFTRLKQISNGASVDSVSIYKDYFNCACVTSVDVERSFSKYKNIYSSRRTSLSATNMETYLMLQTYYQSYPLGAMQ